MPLAKLLITAALTAANIAVTMLKHTEGPRLDNLKVTVADYGTPLSRIYGKGRIEGAPIIFAEDIKEVESTSKTKGGKFTNFIYYGTWANAICYNEIQAVARIFADKHLIVDYTGPGPISPMAIGYTTVTKGGTEEHNIDITDHLTIYYGTETQNVDPRIQATNDALKGAGTTTAFRGLSYIVFKDVPLEKFGNRLPQIDIEALSAGSVGVLAINYTPTYTPSPFFPAVFSTDYRLMAWMNGSHYTVWDVASSTELISGNLGLDGGNPFGIGLLKNGTILFAYNEAVYSKSLMGPTTLYYPTNKAYGVQAIADGNGGEHWGTFPTSISYTAWFDGASISFAGQPSQYFRDGWGNVWVVGHDEPGSTTAYFKRLVTVDATSGWPESFTVTMPVSSGLIQATESGDNILIWWGGYLYLIDPVTQTYTATGTAVNADDGTASAWKFRLPGTSSLYLNNKQIDIATGTLVRSISGVPDVGSSYDEVYDPISHAIVGHDNSLGYLTWYYLDRVTDGAQTLGAIAGKVSDLVGISSYDYSALDQVVSGWTTAGVGQAANMLAPLFDAYSSVVRQHNFTVQGIKKSGTSAGTITSDLFVAQPAERYNIPIQQPQDIASGLYITFADSTADHQANVVYPARNGSVITSQGQAQLALDTWSGTPNEALSLGIRYFRQMWNERRKASNKLPPSYLALEPGDSWTIAFDDVEWVMRLTKAVYRMNEVIDCDWVFTSAGAITAPTVTGVDMTSRPATEVVVPGLSASFDFDVPLLADVYEQSTPIMYYGAAPYNSTVTWYGATTYEKVGSDFTQVVKTFPPSGAASWGLTRAALGNPPCPWMWDYSSINIQMKYGTLTSCTEDDIYADPTLNMAILGQEIVNFTTATALGGGLYAVSGWRRAQRGTEWATSGHYTDEVFVLVNNLRAGNRGASDVGTDLAFKSTTVGTVSPSFEVDVAFAGNSSKPYAPYRLRGVKNFSTNAWTLTWARRVRVGGLWRPSTAFPIGETSEAYELEIMNGSTVIRTVTGLSSPTYTYTSAMQVTDFGSNQSSVTFRVYQISSVVGRGFVAQRTV